MYLFASSSATLPTVYTTQFRFWSPSQSSNANAPDDRDAGSGTLIIRYGDFSDVYECTCM